MVMHATAQHIQQAIVLGQLLQVPGFTVLREVAGRGAQHTHILRRHRQRDQAGVFGFAVAQGDVHRLAKQVGNAVAQQQAHGQLRVLTLEFIQPRQQMVAAEVRRRRQLQHAADMILAAGQ